MLIASRVLWLALVLIIRLRAAIPDADDFSSKLVAVHDGDTITVLMDRTPVKIRLFGIDCPETGQDLGSRAKAITSELAFGKVVAAHGRGSDRYARTVADVILPDGRTLNHELVRRGVAWWYRRFAPNDSTLSILEAEARSAGKGLWSQANPVPPWEWSQRTKSLRVPGSALFRSP